MAQYINGLRVPSDGIVRHVAGFGQGDNGYDVLVTKRNNSSVPCVISYFLEDGKKKSVSVSKLFGGYSIEYGTYSDSSMLESCLTQSCSLSRVPRKYLTETVKAYRAYRIIFNEYKGVRDEIIDATKGIECIYIGNIMHDKENFMKLLERLGFHVESVDFNMIKTKEGICIMSDGICYKE